MWTFFFFKLCIEFITILFLFWCFGFKAYRILAPWPGIAPTPHALEGEVLTTGPPGKALCLDLFFKTLVSAPGKVLLGQDIVESVLCFPRLCSFHKNFSAVQSLSRVRLWDPMDCNMPGFPVHHQLPEFTQTPVHWVGDAIQPSHPLPSPSPPAFPFPASGSFPMSQLFASGGQSIGVSNVCILCSPQATSLWFQLPILGL